MSSEDTVDNTNEKKLSSSESAIFKSSESSQKTPESFCNSCFVFASNKPNIDTNESSRYDQPIPTEDDEKYYLIQVRIKFQII